MERRSVEDVNSITFRLESYLLQLSEINHRWSEWLERNELAVFGADRRLLHEIEVEGLELMRELSGILAGRQQILDDARAHGMPANDLQSLARGLPAWNRPTFRGTVSNAKLQLENLRRLHVAIWVLITQQLYMVRDTKAILMCGTLQRDVYTTNAMDCGGGQLLDASL
jgi:hypothetical protein